MRSLESRKVLVVLATVFVILCAVFLVLLSGRDTEPPVISFPEGEAVYTGNKEELINGVTASDAKEGDVSGSLVVDSVARTQDGKSVRVHYAAKDSSGNVCGAVRVMKCADSTETEKEKPRPSPTAAPSPSPTPDPGKPVIHLVADTVSVNAEDGAYIIEFVESVTDDKDSPEDLFHNISVLGEYDLSVPGTYHVEYIALDSDGNESDRAKLTINVS